ncbi:MAG: glycoside hydrolase family 26 protein [Thermoleophilia bacterium]
MALLGSAAMASGAARSEPPDGQVISGVAPEYPASNVAAFARMTGQPGIAVYHRFLNPLEPFNDVLGEIKSINAAGMITWRMMASSSSAPGGNHASIARGDIDSYLVAQGAAAAAFGRPLFLRPNWEMNGDWFVWSTYTSGGSQRPGNSPAQYRQSWQRARIIFEGGSQATVNSRLAAVGLPPLTAGGANLPSATNVAWVWSVTKGPVKQPQKPHKTSDYYPGDPYVDWVGVSLHQYGSTTLSHWTTTIDTKGDPVGRLDDFYNEFAVRHGKPMMLSEWAVAGPPLGNGDNAQYIRDVFAWIAARPKVKAQIYFNRNAGSTTHRLESHPKARAAFTESVTRIHSIFDWRQISTGGPAPLPASSTPVAPAAPSPSKTTTKKTTPSTKTAPRAACSVNGLVGVLPATTKRERVGIFRTRRATVRLSATKRWVKGVVVARGRKPSAVTVTLTGRGVAGARKNARRWVFGARLAPRVANQDLVVTIRRPRAKVQRVRVRLATTKAAVRAAPTPLIARPGGAPPSPGADTPLPAGC